MSQLKAQSWIHYCQHYAHTTGSRYHKRAIKQEVLAPARQRSDSAPATLGGSDYSQGREVGRRRDRDGGTAAASAAKS